MSRSFGDLVAHSVGVIPDPGTLYLYTFWYMFIIDIMKYDVNDDDKFIILASDGVWEFLSNE